MKILRDFCGDYEEYWEYCIRRRWQALHVSHMDVWNTLNDWECCLLAAVLFVDNNECCTFCCEAVSFKYGLSVLVGLQHTGWQLTVISRLLQRTRVLCLMTCSGLTVMTRLSKLLSTDLLRKLASCLIEQELKLQRKYD